MKIGKLVLLLMLISTAGLAQETLNANDPNSFIFGGDQGSNVLSVDLLPVAIADIEPDPGAAILFGGVSSLLEAGLVAGASPSGSFENEDLWLNYTYRSINKDRATIFVSSNQPVPSGMTIEVQVIGVGAGGDFKPLQVKNPITVSETEQEIITGFKSGYTGDGLFNGYQLKYIITNNDGASLPAGFEINYRIQI